MFVMQNFVMAFEPTEEQSRAREVFAAGDDLALVAGAGTGKTSTLALMGAARGGRGLYLAFNRATANDATQRFPRHVECRTAHSLAFWATGTEYRERLRSAARIPNLETARLLEIDRDIVVDSSRITRAHQARLVMGMIRRFCYSNDTEVMARHMEPVNGLAPLATDYVARVLLRYAVRAWEDICSSDGKLRFEHDHYLKMWALTRPVLRADFVLLDEAQDTNPVVEEIFLAQRVQRVCVGDPAQQIYAWRSARDVMTGFPAEHLKLTWSFRFGPPIAEVANRWLRHAESDMRLVGSGSATSRVGAFAGARADAVLCRGNADVIKEIMTFLDDGVRVALTGGGEALHRLAEAAQELKAGQRTGHPELFLFSSWGEVQDYVENDDAAQDLRSLVRLVDEHGPETIIEAGRRLSSEENAQVTVSTAHKAKGREWDSVRIGPGFEPPPADDVGRQRPLLPEEARLIYVAVTRARRMLDPAGLAWADEYEKAVAPAADGTVGGRPMIDLPLTAQLRYEGSPVSVFMAERLPGHHVVVRDYLARIRSLPRPIQPTDVRYPAWSALGHTIDFRLRLSLGCPLGDSVSASVALIGGDTPLRGMPSAAARAALHAAGRELLATVSGIVAGASRVSPSEEELTRLCFVAAFFEDVYRTGEVRRHSMLAAVTPATRLRSLLRAVPSYVIGDIGQQLRLAEKAFREFRSLPRRAVACGAEFAGSADIGGADADFILDGLLLDCKATRMPSKLGRDEIYQLAGYLLLDYPDEFRIRRVGLYLSRQGGLVSWDVEEFLRMLGCVEPLPSLRDRLNRRLAACHASRHVGA